MLYTTNIVKSRRGKVYSVFTTYVSKDFINDTTLPSSLKSSQYVSECWRRYRAYAATLAKENNSMNGKIFEAIIATELYRQKILLLPLSQPDFI